MQVDIVIPTLHRVDKLANCLYSIKESISKARPKDTFKIHVNFSDPADIDAIRSRPEGLIMESHTVIPDFRAPAAWNDYLLSMSADAMLYLSDDVILSAYTLNRVCTEMDRRFDTYDGIVCLYLSNLPQPQPVNCAFGLMGKRFADRFPDRQAFCPEYMRFYADRELDLYAIPKKLVYIDSTIPIKHMHAAHYPEMLDDTHYDARKWLKRDRDMFVNRKQRKLIWGDSYVRIEQ